MKLPIRMTSLTGNKNKGFTFIEIMITLVILSAGIVMIYKSFFLCVDYLSYLTCRLYASQMIEGKISDITRSYRESSDSSFDRGATTETMEMNHKWIDFNYGIEMSPVLGLDYLYRLRVTLSWYDGKHLMKLSRESLLSKI
ncbi:MAG: prepilin-type N-terminal cleavage/methylation domain-containing protein [Candidatus Omnitrophica bacterium]|nr:prepilin-type N-terminal cleavage/methylation domain-containing protein [Candidatus Omnitrophota bacterium]